MAAAVDMPEISLFLKLYMIGGPATWIDRYGPAEMLAGFAFRESGRHSLWCSGKRSRARQAPAVAPPPNSRRIYFSNARSPLTANPSTESEPAPASTIPLPTEETC